MQSQAKTVDDYIASLPADRQTAIAAVRDVILKNLDADFEEGMQYGMIGYYVPHRIYPSGYHCNPKEPLPFAGLASQKNHMAIYLMSLYSAAGPDCDGENPHSKWFREAWEKTGKKLDMGKACIRFKKLDHIPLDVIGEAIRRTPASKYLEAYQAIRDAAKATKPKTKPAAKKPKK